MGKNYLRFICFSLVLFVTILNTIYYCFFRPIFKSQVPSDTVSMIQPSFSVESESNPLIVAQRISKCLNNIHASLSDNQSSTINIESSEKDKIPDKLDTRKDIQRRRKLEESHHSNTSLNLDSKKRQNLGIKKINKSFIH